MGQHNPQGPPLCPLRTSLIGPRMLSPSFRQLLLICQNWHQGVTWDTVLVCLPDHIPGHLLRLTESRSPAGAPRPRPPQGEAPQAPVAFAGIVTAIRAGGTPGGLCKEKCQDALKVPKTVEAQEEQRGALWAMPCLPVSTATKAIASGRTRVTWS